VQLGHKLFNTKSEIYVEEAKNPAGNEDVLLQTLGFNLVVQHPHLHIICCCDLVSGVLLSLQIEETNAGDTWASNKITLKAELYCSS
jgi:hypothetical protein